MRRKQNACSKPIGAIYLENYDAGSGGKHTFQQIVMDSLIAFMQLKELDYPQVIITGRRIVRYPRLNDTNMELSFWEIVGMRIYCFIHKLKIFSRFIMLRNYDRHMLEALPIEYILARRNISFVMCLSQLSFPLSVPYSLVVWDLAHLTHPWLPEMNRIGEWSYRDESLRVSIKRSAHILTGAVEHKNEIVRNYGVSPNKIHVCPFPIKSDIQILNSNDWKDEVKKRSNLLIYPAQLWPHKNHLTLINSLPEILRNQPDLKVLLVGGNRANVQKALKKKIHELNLSEVVKLTGFIPRKELQNLFTSARYLVFPSLLGPDNLPPLEAVAHGVPHILLADIQGSRELYGEAFIYFDPWDSSSIANAMIKVVDKDSPSQLQLSARSKLIKRSSGDQYAKQLIETWKSLEKMAKVGTVGN